MDYIYENGALKNEAKEVTGHKGQYEAKTNDGSFEHTVIIAKNTKDNTAGFGNGVTVELFENDTNHYTMVAIPQFIGTIGSVTKADADKGIDRSVTVTGAGSFDTENFEKGDIVLYTTGSNGIASMTEAKTISGKVTKISNGEIYTIDGNTYELSQNNNITTALRVGDKGTWYVDTFGNIIDTKESDSEDVYYGYLLAYGRNSANDADLFGNGAEDNGEKVKFVNASGEKVVLDCAYDTDKDGNVTTWVAPDEWETYGSNVLFAYELNSKGEISKITVASETWTTNEQTITKGNAVMTKSTLALTKDTVFFYVDTTNEEYAVYTGYKNVPTKTGNLVARIHNDSEMIALVLSVSDVNATSDKQYVYFAGDDVDVETTEDDTIYTYTNVYVDGVKTTLVNDSALTFTVGHIYDYTTDNDGYATLGSTNIDATTAGTEITNIQATYFKAGSMIYTDDDTVYYEVDQDNKTISVVEGLPELSKKDAYDVMLLWNDKGTDSDTGADLVVFYTK